MKPSDFDNRQTQILKNIKNSNIRDLENIDVSRLMFNVSGEALKTTKYASIKKLIRTVLFDVIKVEYSVTDSNLPLVITYDYHREDHTNYWEKFKSIVAEYNEIYIEEGRKNYSRVRKPCEIINVITHYLRTKRQLVNIENSTIRRVLATNLAELINFKRKLDRHKFNCQSAFIFFDGNRVENLVVQTLRNCGVTVATMQHGQPVFHGLDTDRINQTMILNFTSDYIMVTGEFSKKQFMLGGIIEEQIFVGGSLRNIKGVTDTSEKDFAVFLDCPTNPNAARDNKELIECAKQISELLGSHFVIKCHPQDSPQNYADFSEIRGTFVPKGISIEKTLEGKGFGILHASGVYLDIISEGTKAFCYVNDTDFPLVEKGIDSFTTTTELIDKIEEWDSYSDTKKREYMNRIIDYYLCPYDVKNRYKAFVKKLNTPDS